jgi:hypothetical protein
MAATQDPGAKRARKRRRSFPLIWLGSIAAAVILALGVGGSLSAFGASITNSANSVGTGSLVMAETGPGTTGSVTCLSSQDTTGNNSSTCSTINKYGNAGIANTTMEPGGVDSTTVTISNTGTVAATAFTLAFGACTQTPAAGTPSPGNLCSEMTVAVYVGTGTGGLNIIPAETLTAAASALATPITAPSATPAISVAGAGQAFTFVVSLPGTASNIYQGIGASQPITWTFTQ